MNKKFLITLLILFVLILTGSLMVIYQVYDSESDFRETKRRAEPIIAALESYKSQVGVYPNMLDDLIPHYLAKLADPTIGNHQWLYKRLESGEDYMIMVLPTSLWHIEASYFGSDGEWEHDRVTN